jgi:hypothetical protein
VVERVNSSKNELFGTVARPKPGLVEINQPLYQCLQARRHLKILLLILDQRRKKVLVWPLEHIFKVDVKPPSGGNFLVAPKLNIQVFIPTSVA